MPSFHSTNILPREIVSELDRYIIGQGDAKRAVAIALRNRWRRQQVPAELRDEIAPKNIIMIGPTGVGKTEIARRLAKLANAPFIKVEASKFTEVGYVGKDVESMIRELTDVAVKMAREEEQKSVEVRAQELAEERLLDLLLPQQAEEEGKTAAASRTPTDDLTPPEPKKESDRTTREKLRKMLREGKLDGRTVEMESRSKAGPMPSIEVVAATSLEEMSSNLREMFSNMLPHGAKRRKLKVPEALEQLAQEEAMRLIDMEAVTKLAVDRVEQNGIIFLDEIDKIVSDKGESRNGPDVSREGVQRDILPIVEGSTVSTKHGMVRTDHILFIAAGAFHGSKPSDMIPELQGRFPIRVELKPLTKEDFLRIVTEPENSLTKQYIAMIETEGVALGFREDALEELCEVAATVNRQTEDIGARRLHTVMEKLLEEVSFNAPEMKEKQLTIDRDYVVQRLESIVRDRDLSKYIL